MFRLRSSKAGLTCAYSIDALQYLQRLGLEPRVRTLSHIVASQSGRGFVIVWLDATARRRIPRYLQQRHDTAVTGRKFTAACTYTYDRDGCLFKTREAALAREAELLAEYVF